MSERSEDRLTHTEFALVFAGRWPYYATLLQRKRRMVIVDPSIIPGVGHHLAVAERIRALSREFGIATRVAGNLRLGPVRRLRPGWSAVFRNTFYELRALETGSEERRAGLARLDEDMARILSATPSRDCQVLFACADAFQLAAAHAAATRLLDAGRRPPDLHFSTPYDLNALSDHMGRDAVLAAIGALRALSRRGVYVRFHGETQPLATQLGEQLGFRIGALELPPDNAFLTRLPKRTRSGPLKVGVFGPARREKGFHLLPGIIQATRDRGIPVEFYIQIQAPVADFHSEVLDTIDRLTRLADAGSEVTLHRGRLRESAYLKLFAASDVILMPYLVRTYASRGSGIFVQALSAGKIIVATQGTFMTAYPTFGALKAKSEQDFADRLAEIAADPESYRKHAAAARRRYLQRNRPSRFFAKLFHRPPPPEDRLHDTGQG